MTPHLRGLDTTVKKLLNPTHIPYTHTHTHAQTRSPPRRGAGGPPPTPGRERVNKPATVKTLQPLKHFKTHLKPPNSSKKLLKPLKNPKPVPPPAGRLAVCNDIGEAAYLSSLVVAAFLVRCKLLPAGRASCRSGVRGDTSCSVGERGSGGRGSGGAGPRLMQVVPINKPEAAPRPPKAAPCRCCGSGMALNLR